MGQLFVPGEVDHVWGGVEQRPQGGKGVEESIASVGGVAELAIGKILQGCWLVLTLGQPPWQVVQTLLLFKALYKVVNQEMCPPALVEVLTVSSKLLRFSWLHRLG